MATRAEFDQILDRVYQDNPTWWPHGLKRAQLDEAFAIRDPATRKLAGFTGWQVRRDEMGKPSGYYSVGLLPEFRRQGLAKRALQEMFTQHRPAGVEDIRAYIVPGNEPSMKLADRLGVPVQHKMACLRSRPLPSMLTKMAKRTSYVPGSYGGISLQQFMPLAPRRTTLNPEEQANVDEGASQWFPKVFPSMADSPAADMASPGKVSLMAALAGGGLAGTGAHLLGAKPEHAAMVGGGAALLAGLLGYHHRKANNEGIVEMMRRLPPGGTRRDMLADPVLQQELNRASQTGSSEEALRTAQLLAILKATSKTASVKQATTWMAKTLAHLGRYAGRHSLRAGAGASTAWDAFSYDGKYDNIHGPRIRDWLLNAGLFAAAAHPSLLKSKMRFATAMSVPVKDLASSAGATVNNINAILPKIEQAVERSGTAGSSNVNITAPGFFDQTSKYVAENPGKALTGGLLGAGLLGGAGYLGLKGINALQGVADRAERPESGRIRVTLPTRSKGDAETQLDLPVQEMALSDALVGKIRRDVRGRLRSETNERTKRVTLSPEEKQRRAELLAAYRANN
jgi:GNAT superfamily N-acetyltransferase